MTLDIVMPKLDGVSVLRQIREESPDARIVMVSAVDQRGKLTECIKLGALDFIVKPFDKSRLKSFFLKYGDPAPVSESRQSADNGRHAD
jgi:two-component system chemotaxis response regulator CheY